MSLQDYDVLDHLDRLSQLALSYDALACLLPDSGIVNGLPSLLGILNDAFSAEIESLRPKVFALSKVESN